MKAFEVVLIPDVKPDLPICPSSSNHSYSCLHTQPSATDLNGRKYSFSLQWPFQGSWNFKVLWGSPLLAWGADSMLQVPLEPLSRLLVSPFPGHP